MKALAACLSLGLLLALVPSISGAKPPPKHTSTLGTAKITAPANLAPGEYVWHPELSPQGPVVLVVTLTEQRAYVYRNGVIIGVSTISSGKQGHETPTGVFTILQKHEDHYSNLYADAPMPYMQRLTWSGVALHAGKLPGYPASHGCIRMPYEFARQLFAETKTGLTVVVSDEKHFPSTVAHPGLIAPVDTAGKPASDTAPVGEFVWQPEVAPEGPVTILVTVEDRRVRVFRSGIEIGNSPFELADPNRRVTLHVFTMLEPRDDDPVSTITGRRIPRWLRVSGESPETVSSEQFLSVFKIPEALRRAAAGSFGPGTTLVITQLAATPATTTTPASELAVVVAEAPAKH